MIHPHPPWRRLASRLGAPEGPVLAPNGWMLNVCSFTPTQPGWPTRGGDITATRLDRPGHTHTVCTTSTPQLEGIPAALAFGPDGCLYVTDEGRGAIVRVTPDGDLDDLITSWQGRPLNGPNDLVFDARGNLFFTDPWGSTLDRRIGAVYGYDWAAGRLHQLADGLAFPNGIVLHDGLLIVAETHTGRLWGADVTGPGRVGVWRQLARTPPVDTSGWQGPDGMAVDADGNLYVAHLGSGDILVYDPTFVLADRIASGGVRPTNLCFAGPDLRTLCVTVDDLGELRTLTVGVAGRRLHHCPSRIPDHPWARMLPPDPTEAREPDV